MMAYSDYILRLATAFVLGALIGLERQWREHMAGLRTNTLVATGAAVFTLAALMLENDTTSEARIIGQIVTGIGFLGAGVIMREGLNIRGINTAATIWCSAAIGSMAALGFLIQASIGTVFILLVNFALRKLAHFINQFPLSGREFESMYRFKILIDHKAQEEIRSLLTKTLAAEGLGLSRIHFKKENHYILVKADISTPYLKPGVPEKIAATINALPSVQELSWEMVMGGYE